MVQAPSRRDRVRAATTQEIIQTARKLLVQDGPEAVSLRAIAREMGMTAPALYRYFGSHEELLRHVVADIFTELATHVRTAVHVAADASNSDLPEAEVMVVKMIAGCREFRAWTLAHVPEFSMIFGSPLPGMDVLHEIHERPDDRLRLSVRPGLPGPVRRFVPAAPVQHSCRRGNRALAARAARAVSRARRTLICRSVRCRPSCAAGCCCTGPSAWKPSATCGSPSTTPRRCSS